MRSYTKIYTPISHLISDYLIPCHATIHSDLQTSQVAPPDPTLTSAAHTTFTPTGTVPAPDNDASFLVVNMFCIYGLDRELSGILKGQVTQNLFCLTCHVIFSFGLSRWHKYILKKPHHRPFWEQFHVGSVSSLLHNLVAAQIGSVLLMQ